MADDASTLMPAATRKQDGSAVSVGTKAAGRYQITRFIAAGAMGEVYAADDLVVGTQVALKVLRAELSGSPEAVERLRREIALARKVTNVHVCRLHDVGEHDGRVFLTMELLDGITLAEHVRARGPLPIDAVEQLAAQVVDGLAALHDAGIVHRDFKTANTILVGDRAVITDFGLARSLDAGDAALTAEATLLGTPSYMAPEQVEGRVATPASDVYALGVVLFELITGQVPFREDTALATATARLHKAPPRIASLRDDVPPRWDAIVARCLERDPAARFANVRDVLAGTVRRRRWPVAVALALAGTGTLAVVLASRTPPAAAPQDTECPSAAKKLVGIWDVATRATIALRFQGHPKQFVADAWRRHGQQFDQMIASWAPRWDAACASSDRTKDPLLHAQRLTCLDTYFVQTRSYINNLADTTIDPADFARGTPGEFPVGLADECDIVPLLRVQLPMPPLEHRAEIDRLMIEGNAARARLRMFGTSGVAVDHKALNTQIEQIETRLIELGHPSGAGDLRYWRLVLGRFWSDVETDKIATSLVELAERHRDDHLLVRALMQRLTRRAYRAGAYDVQDAEATIARAVQLAGRIGNPPSLRFDIAEAELAHARRVGLRDRTRRALEDLARLSSDVGLAYMPSWYRGDLADLDTDGAAAKRILADNVALLGAWNLNLVAEYNALDPVIARAGDLETALANQRRALAIIEAARGSKPSNKLFPTHARALTYALRLGRSGDANAHARGAIAALVERGQTELAAYAQLVDDLRMNGEVRAARHVLGLARDVAGSAEDRDSLAEAELVLRLETGQLRSEELAAALARFGTDEPVLRARVLYEAGKYSEVLALLVPIAEQLRPAERRGRLLVGLALVETQPEAAIEALEKVADGHTLVGSEARFGLARALHATKQDQRRAKELASAARTTFEALDAEHQVAAVDRWLEAIR